MKAPASKAELRAQAAAAAAAAPITKVPEGERAAQKLSPISAQKKTKGKPGRPAKSGERYPCGKLKTRAEIAPALLARIKTNAIRFGEDPRMASQLMVYSMLGHFTRAQTAAGMRLAEIYGRFERSQHIRRSAKSAAYTVGYGDPDVAEDRMTADEIAELEQRVSEARAAFIALQEDIPAYPPNARSILEQVCVEDQPIDPSAIESVAAMLDHLASAFGEKWNKKKPGPGPKVRPSKTKPPAPGEAGVKVPPAQKVAFCQTLARLRPDLSEADIDKAWSLQTELADRERLRREKDFRKLHLSDWSGSTKRPRTVAESTVNHLNRPRLSLPGPKV